MTWNAYLECACCGSYTDPNKWEDSERSWNYTMSTNGMIHAACDAVFPPSNDHWVDQLNGMTGPEGGQFLAAIVAELERDPDHYRAMDPSNGWVVGILRAMASAVPEYPTVWRTNR